MVLESITANDCSPESEPARPEKLTVEFYDEPDGLAIHTKPGGGPGCFLAIWLSGWTVGCVFLLVVVVSQPSLAMFAFAVPFWASWLFVAGLLAWIWFGKETLLLRRDDALFLRSAIVKLSSRRVPRHEIQQFRECESSHTEDDEHLLGIEMSTLGKPLQFAFRLPEGERAWLIHRLNAFLGTAAQGATAASRLPETLNHENTRDDPPTDSLWRVTETHDSFRVTRPGKWKLGPLGLLLFLNAFWNGIVCVFVLVLCGLMPDNPAPQGNEWWKLFAFLLPFEAIGLAMFGALILATLAPFVRMVWRCESRAVVRQIVWPLYLQTKAWDVPSLDRLELRREKNGSPRFADPTDLFSPAAFELALVSADNRDLCTIRRLTEGEARWIARVIITRRPDWFRGGGDAALPPLQ